MFEKDDILYILDGAAFNKNKTLKIIKRKFNYFKNQNKDIICCSGETDFDVAKWAVSKTEDEAYKLALVYIINTLELKKEINSIDINSEYEFIELNHADLILKYTDNIEVSQR